ncbi:nucleoid occlusion factor SlmA [Alteromonas sp. LMIT006]|jgi:TetR/AcrR family transcriptional regulator|uniref:nucleoid occlusion factor SlmA n=1 Tax=Alteromonadaceae TaxID=72275 RepID=UPI0020CA44D1|nr:nucleoid occlusion factor SlmA [Alteromonas sp. LMIT006]UTP73323.1 nucleoid occlusion factor SlmA [Alteromonas sp. LMIT006]
MAEQKRKPNRRAHILQCLASMLENNSGKRITTAALAAEVGVSEAALYRHFPSKARMYEGLIDFVEDTLFSRINKIINDEKDTAVRIQMVLHLFLGFSEKNPGIARILHGDALTGEHERLRSRVAKIFERLETQIKQILRERKVRDGKTFSVDESALAALLTSYVDGRINAYIRSEFKRRPTEQFSEIWTSLKAQYFA